MSSRIFHKRSAGRAFTETTFSLARALSKLGYCSRTDAVVLIDNGRVTVGGVPAKSATQRVDIARDHIAVNGVEVVASAKLYYMLHKPRGLITTRRDPHQRGTVYDQLPRHLPFLSPVGRLDKASEGVLLLTNDTRWAECILNPASRIPKIYHVKIDCAASKELILNMRRPIMDRGEVLNAVSVHVLRSTSRSAWLEVVLTEGRNRQVRRMVASQGANVLRLVRTAIGNVRLGCLGKGETRALTPSECASLWPIVRSSSN